MRSQQLTVVVILAAHLFALPAAHAGQAPVEETRELVALLARLGTASDCRPSSTVRRDWHRVATWMQPSRHWRRVLEERALPSEVSAGLEAGLVELTRRECWPRIAAKLSRSEPRVRVGQNVGRRSDVLVDTSAGDPPLVFHWRRDASGWTVDDVSYAGISLVDEHRDQLDRLLERHGPEVLMQRIARRLHHAPARHSSAACLLVRQ